MSNPKNIEKIAREYALKNKSSHGFDHTERVLSLALHIGKKEGADLEIIELAALLHDIGRHRENETLGEVCHAEEGAKLSRKILKEACYDENVIEKVTECIENHRYRGNKVPKSLEARVLFDADKLDSIGAIGIGRAFMFAAEVGAMVHNPPGTDISKTKSYGPDDTAYREFWYKLKHVHERILTKEGKRIAGERHKYMVEFFDRIEMEGKGEI